MNNTPVVESKKWDEEARQLVRAYDFDLDRVYSNTSTKTIEGKPIVKNCEFCGQAIVYVAYIKGTPKFAKVNTVIARQIGCDCVQRVLGETWHHFHSMQQQLKTLKEVAAAESRKVKYAVKYKNYIDWLKNLPVHILKNDQLSYTNGFLKDMLRILTTGEKIFSKNMEAELLRLMKDERYSVKNMVQNKHNVEDQVRKMRVLLEMIQKIDGSHIHEKWSAFEFVNNVLAYTINKNGATKGQLEGLNKVWVRYSNKLAKAEAAQKSSGINVNDPAIPY